MNLSIKLLPETVRSLAFGSIAAGYAAVGTGLTNPSRILLVQNLTDVNLMFSFNGTNDHVPLSANGYLLLDVMSNKSVSNAYYVAKGTIIYVKRIGVPTTGSVYVTTFYGAE